MSQTSNDNPEAGAEHRTETVGDGAPILTQMVKANMDADRAALGTHPMGITADQQRTDTVAKILETAYAKASTLQLTKEESQQLLAPFPDEAVYRGAGGKDDLLYVTHSYIEERLNTVLGIGQWCFVPRQSKLDTNTGKKDYKGNQIHSVLVDGVMLVRGAFVGEDWASMDYIPANKSQSYDDAFSGAQSNAIRRIAGKRLGVGAQVWKKDYCEAWKARHKLTSGATSTQPLREGMTAVQERKPELKKGDVRDFTGPVASVTDVAKDNWQGWDIELADNSKLFRVFKSAPPNHGQAWAALATACIADKKPVTITEEFDGKVWRVRKLIEADEIKF